MIHSVGSEAAAAAAAAETAAAFSFFCLRAAAYSEPKFSGGNP